MSSAAAPGAPDSTGVAPAIEWLEHGRILQSMPPAARGEVAWLGVERESASTQQSALAAPPPRGGCAIHFAEAQSAGQGRLGRTWVSPPGANLYFSVARRFSGPLQRLSGLSLAVGVAVAEALRAQGYAQVGLKWPNDLLADGRKLGGILVNAQMQDAFAHVVVGVGVNVAMPPDVECIDQPWIDLSQLSSPPISRNRLAAAVLGHLLPALAGFDAEGLAPFIERWHRLHALQGRQVRVIDGAREQQGLCLGIADSGALRLRTADGETTLHSGEISVRAA